MMEICVAGWYFDDDYVKTLHEVSKRYKVTIVSHIEDTDDPYMLGKILVVPTKNIGLEFGCYDYFLKDLWSGYSNVLFTHDDMRICDVSVFDKINELDIDCGYIFRDAAEERANGGKHGRAIFASARFLGFLSRWVCMCQWSREQPDRHNKGRRLPRLSSHSGFWYDPNNKGHTCGKPPVGVRHYNEAIYHFHWTLGRIRDRRCGPKENWPHPDVKMDVVNRIFFNGWEAGRRNLWRHKKREQRKYGSSR